MEKTDNFGSAQAMLLLLKEFEVHRIVELYNTQRAKEMKHVERYHIFTPLIDAVTGKKERTK